MISSPFTKHLLGFIRRAGSERSTAKVLAEMSRFIGESLAAHRVTVYLTEGDRLIPYVSEFASGIRRPHVFERWRELRVLGQSPALGRIHDGEDAVLVEDPHEFLPREAVEAFDVQPLLLVALRAEGSLSGVLVVEGDVSDLRVRRDDVRQFAEFVALALENARAFERENERVREAEALLEVGKVLGETTDPIAVLAAVARNTARVTGFERCSILLVDDDGELIPTMSQFADGHRDLEAWERFTSTRADLPAARAVMERRAPVAYHDAESVPDLLPSVWVTPFGIRSALLVPLTAWDECFGVLLLDHRRPRQISPQQMRMAEGVAVHGAVAIAVARLLERERASREQAEEATATLLVREVQQATVARLGRLALTGADLDVLMDEVVTALAETLSVEYAKVLELRPCGDALRLRAGVGWKDGLVGSATVPTDVGSQAGFTLRSGAPVVVEDLTEEERFHAPDLLLDHGVVSGMSVVIGGGERPFGVLGVHSTRPRSFTEDDIHFLESVANLLAAAIARKEAEWEMQELIRSKDEFLASISHELRTPLTGIVGFIELLRDPDCGLAAHERSEVIDIAAREAFDLSHIVQDLLVAARADIGTLRISRVPVDLRAQVAQVLEAWNGELEVTVSFPGDVVAVGDPSRVRQIVRNLLSNAVRYGGSDITIEGDVGGARAWLRVSDDGEGVPEGDRDRIFEPYHRLRQDAGQPGSVGLGLSVARNLARLMDGDLTYDHLQGRSVFQLDLPAAL